MCGLRFLACKLPKVHHLFAHSIGTIPNHNIHHSYIFHTQLFPTRPEQGWGHRSGRIRRAASVAGLPSINVVSIIGSSSATTTWIAIGRVAFGHAGRVAPECSIPLVFASPLISIGTRLYSPAIDARQSAPARVASFHRIRLASESGGVSSASIASAVPSSILCCSLKNGE